MSTWNHPPPWSKSTRPYSLGKSLSTLSPLEALRSKLCSATRCERQLVIRRVASVIDLPKGASDIHSGQAYVESFAVRVAEMPQDDCYKKRVRQLETNHRIRKKRSGNLLSECSVKRSSGERAMAPSITTIALVQNNSMPPPSPLSSSPLLVNIPNIGKHCRLSAGFYDQAALTLAPLLLGKLLKRDDVILQITEVNNYQTHSISLVLSRRN